MFGIEPSEFIVLLVVAVVVLGPERLPEYAQQLARLIRELRRMAQGASAQVRSELGPEFDEIEWNKLDPRQYDPRRIVRDALADAWDPDDPLGLKEATRLDQDDEPRSGAALEDAEKPQSSGGPTPVSSVPQSSGSQRIGAIGPAPVASAAIGAGVNGAGVNAAGVNGAGVNGAGVNAAGVNGAGVNGAGVNGTTGQSNAGATRVTPMFDPDAT